MSDRLRWTAGTVDRCLSWSARTGGGPPGVVARLRRRLLAEARSGWRLDAIKTREEPLLNALKEPLLVSAGEPLGDVPTVITLRAVKSSRIVMLEAVLTQLNAAGVAPECVRIVDASPAPYSRMIAALAAQAGFQYSNTGGSMAEVLSRYCGEVGRSPFYLQFDDVVTANLSAGLLRASARLVARAGCHLVVAPQWAFEITEGDQVSAVPWLEDYHADGRFYQFREPPGWHRPIAEVTVSGQRFLIFRNFGYGFFFNNLIAVASEFGSRLEWYRAHVSSSVHQIELEAASRSFGPFWTHIAVPASGECLIDIDFNHTEQAVRAENPELRRLAYRLRSDPRIAIISGS